MSFFLNLIKQAILSKITTDDKNYPVAECSYNEANTTFVPTSVYGINSSAPLDSHLLIFSSQGQEGLKFGIPNDYLNRKKNLKEGEIAVYNSKSKSFIFLKENGIISVGNNEKDFAQFDPNNGEFKVEGDDVLLTANTKTKEVKVKGKFDVEGDDAIFTVDVDNKAVEIKGTLKVGDVLQLGQILSDFFQLMSTLQTKGSPVSQVIDPTIAAQIVELQQKLEQVLKK